MPWRRRGDPVITAERINDELVEALAELDKMDATNQKIREMPAMKMKHKASGGASAPAAEFSMAEGDEEEEDFEEAEEELDELDELVIDRNRERKQAVELGDRYSATATRLSSQQKSVKRMAAHLSLYVTQLERRHAELLRWRETCHSWQLAGASEDQCVKEGVLKMERIEHHGIFRRAKVVLVDVSVRIEGEALHYWRCISDIGAASTVLDDTDPVTLRGAELTTVEPRTVRSQATNDLSWPVFLSFVCARVLL